MSTRRGKGEGTLVRKGDGWQVQVSRTVDGKRYRRSATASTKAEALAELVRMRAELFGTKPGNLTPTVADVITNYQRHLDTQVRAGKIRPSTRAWKDDMLAHVPEDLRTKYAKDIAPIDIEAWLAGMEGSASARRAAFINLRLAYKIGMRDRLVNSSPFDGLETPSGERERDPKHATRDDVESLVAAADAPWCHYWRVLADTGMRKGELLALRWDDLDLNTRTLTVRSGKTANARRTIPLTDAAIEALQAIPHHPATNRVCPYSTRYLSRQFEKVAPAGLTPHGLRHGLATRLLESGVPVHTVSGILGHASAKTTLDIYGHVVPDEMRAAMRALA